MLDFWQNPEPVTIVGVGGIGSHVARLLGKGGYAGPLTFIDGDTVAPHNPRNQAYNLTHAGLYKTVALTEQMRRWGAVAPVSACSQHLIGTELLRGVVILCVDKISVRQKSWRTCVKGNEAIPLFIEARMDGNYFTVHALNPANKRHQRMWERYSKYTDEETVNTTAGCGGPTAVIDCVSVVTGVMVRLFMQYVAMREEGRNELINQVQGDLVKYSLTPRSWGPWIEPVDALAPGG